MRHLLKVTPSARDYLIFVPLLLFLAWSMVIWMGFAETVSTLPNSKGSPAAQNERTPWGGSKRQLIQAATPTPTSVPITSHGVAAHGAEAWHEGLSYPATTNTFKGAGIKVGIIDTGFKGFSRIQGSELPPSSRVEAYCYGESSTPNRPTPTPSPNIADCKKSSNDVCDTQNSYDDRRDCHGTAVAEIIMDMVPEASLFISNAPAGQMQTVVTEMKRAGVKVINHSVGHAFDGPGNGTSPKIPSPLKAIDAAVRHDSQSVRNGIVWVNAAGNQAKKTWYGSFVDTDVPANNYLDFNHAVVYAGGNRGGSDANLISINVGERVQAFMRWSETWGRASCDLKLKLYKKHRFAEVVSSNEVQDGNDDPYDYITYVGKATDGPNPSAKTVDYYLLVEKQTCLATPSWIQLQVLGSGADDIHFYSGRPPYSSSNYYHIGNPAESSNRGMLAVGAATYSVISNRPTIEDYSNRGPAVLPLPPGTVRIEPDLVGTVCVRTKTISRFCGTSAAAPHVAGMAALVLQKHNTYTPVQVVDYLKREAEARTTTDPNNIWGEGFAKLPTVAATATLAAVPSTMSEGSSISLALTTNLSSPPGIRVHVSYGKLAIGSCPGSNLPSRAYNNGETITISACSSGSATIKLYKAGLGGSLLQTYTVRVQNAPAVETASLSPAPSYLTVGYDTEFTVVTNVPDSPGVWVSVIHTGDVGRLAIHGCFDRTADGLQYRNGSKVAIRGCKPGTATIRIYKNRTSTILKSYTVTVNPSPDTGTLSPTPATAFTVGYDQSFTVNTNIPDSRGVWVGVNFAGDTGKLAIHGCHRGTGDGRKFTNRSTVTIRGCAPGTATIRINRNGTRIVLATYQVTVNTSTDTGTLSPTPAAAFTVGYDRSFTVNTNIPNNRGVWINVNYPGDTGSISLSSHKCFRGNVGTKFTNGSKITLRGCAPGTATIKVFRNGTRILLTTYQVTVNASTDTARLSPVPGSFTVGRSQTFRVVTNVAATPGVWVGSGENGKVAIYNCPRIKWDGRKLQNNSTVTIRGCAAGNGEVHIYRNGTRILLKTYTVTVR